MLRVKSDDRQAIITVEQPSCGDQVIDAMLGATIRLAIDVATDRQRPAAELSERIRMILTHLNNGLSIYVANLWDVDVTNITLPPNASNGNADSEDEDE